MGTLYLHNDIFLADVIGYDWLNLLKFIPQKNKILGTALFFVVHIPSASISYKFSSSLAKYQVILGGDCKAAPSEWVSARHGYHGLEGFDEHLGETRLSSPRYFRCPLINGAV